MSAPHLHAGRRGETFARRWLEARGLTHICSNFNCRFGELDLVMLDRGCLTIIEVRYRQNTDYGGALTSVTSDKSHRLARAASLFLQRHRQYRELRLRFDVLALSGPLAALKVDWRKQALQFDDGD